MKNIIKNEQLKFILCLCVFMDLSILAQTYNDDAAKPLKWLRKYWFYRSRLNNDFVKVGRGQGESLVFNERGLGHTSFAPTTDVTFKMGDATSTQGYYIAVLALEYHLLEANHNNEKTDSTLYELFCAIDAINRLDLMAEKILTDSTGTGGNGILNGFFVRDDVYPDFVKDNYDHFNYFSAGINNNDNSRGFASLFQKGVNKLYFWQDPNDANNKIYGSDYESLYNQGVTSSSVYSTFVSKDQVYALLYGLAFVRKFVPEYVTAKDRYGNLLYFRDGETSISKEAKNIIKRIVDNIRNPKKLDGSGCGDSDWKIRRPDNCSDDLAGRRPFSYAIAESECILDHKYFGDYNLWSVVAPSLCKNTFDLTAQHHTFYSLTIGYETWWGATIPPPLGMHIEDHHLLVTLAAACNCIYLEPSLLPPIGTISTLYNFIPKPYHNKTDERIDKLSSIGNYYWYLFHGPLGRYLLHGGKLEIDNEGPGEWRDRPRFLLNEMNPCGHFNLSGSNYSSLGWSTDTRIEHVERIGNNPDFDIFRGEYPAIDYMLYFNLWTRASSDKAFNNFFPSKSFYPNLSHFYINVANMQHWYWWQDEGYYYPRKVVSSAVSLYKTQINAYETIFMEKTILPFYTNENYMRAGKEIILKATSTPGDGGETYIKPGTLIVTVSDGTATATADAGIRFYIKKYDCASDSGSFDPNTDGSYPYRTTNDSGSNNLRTYKAPPYNPAPPEVLSEFLSKPYTTKSFEEVNEYPYTESLLNDTNFWYAKWIQVLPNPAENEALLIIPDEVNYDRIEITNVLSLLVEKIENQNEHQIKLNISHYPIGVYYINFYNQGRLIHSQKLIKN